MKGNKYIISDGNMKVLENVPKMMKHKRYRDLLRQLTLDFILDGSIKK